MTTTEGLSHGHFTARTTNLVERTDRPEVELIWIVIAFLWGVFMFGFMIAWHFIGQQNLNKEAYRIAPSSYEAKVEQFAKKYKVRDEKGIPVVKPPAGHRRLPARPAVAMVADPRTGEGAELPHPPLVARLAARLLAAADQHQHPGPSRLRARDHAHAHQRGRVRDHLQRVLRDRPSHDDRENLRHRQAGRSRGRARRKGDKS